METIASVTPQHPGIHILKLEGAADDRCPDIERLEPLLDGLIVGGANRIVVEMTDVDCLGHEALATLLWGAIKLRDRGGDMTFAADQDELVEELTRLGVDGMIPIYRNAEQAAEAMAEQ